MAILIDGEELPESAIEYEFFRLKRFYGEHLSEEQLRDQEEALWEKASQQAIGARLLLRDADELEITVPERDIDQRVNEMIDECGDPDNFVALLKERGLAEETLRDSIREGLKVDELTEQILESAGAASTKEVEEFYEEHKEEYATPEQVTARHILVKPISKSAENVATARAKLTEAQSRLNDGDAFEDIAWTVSECPSGRKSGGRLGDIRRGTLVPEMEKPLFALRDGERSDIVETSLGLHILQVDAYQPSRVLPLDEIRGKIEDFVAHARRGELISRYVRSLKDKAVIQETD